MTSVQLSPFVYWAQSECEVTLRIELRNVQSPLVDIQEQCINFSSVGIGAHGEKNYSFSLDIYSPINTETSRYRVTDRQIEFGLVKETAGFWPRLLQDTKKPAWLKKGGHMESIVENVDFDKWTHEEDLEDEVRDVHEDYPGLYDNIMAKEMGWPSKRESLKKVYLFIYNLWQLVGFLYICTVVVTRYLKEGEDSMPGTFLAVGWMMRLCFLAQFLEVLHPLVGYTKGNVFEAVMQVGGRSIIFFCVIQAEERMQGKPFIFYLFLVWSIIECIRYPYYMLRVYNVELGLLTWLRYTIWIPLYPLGFVLEGVVILRSIPYFDETGMFNVSLPNKWNFAFHFPTLLRCYLLFFFFPAMYKMMSHMYNQRTKKLGPYILMKED